MSNIYVLLVNRHTYRRRALSANYSQLAGGNKEGQLCLTTQNKRRTRKKNPSTSASETANQQNLTKYLIKNTNLFC